MPKPTLLILLIAFSFTAPAQRHVQLSGKEEKLAMKFITFAADTPLPRTDSMYWLLRGAPDIALVHLLDHSNPMLRYACFTSLYERQRPIPIDVILGHYDDTDAVTFQGDKMTMRDCFLYNIYNQYLSWHSVLAYAEPGQYDTLKRYRDSLTTAGVIITDAQRQVLDSMLLYDTANTGIVRNFMLFYLAPQPEYYNRVKQITTTEPNNGAAVVALAKYQRADDKKYVINLFKTYKGVATTFGLWAVRYWSDSSFLYYFPSPEGCVLSEDEGFTNLHCYEQFDPYFSALLQYSGGEIDRRLNYCIGRTVRLYSKPNVVNEQKIKLYKLLQVYYGPANKPFLQLFAMTPADMEWLKHVMVEPQLPLSYFGKHNLAVDDY